MSLLAAQSYGAQVSEMSNTSYVRERSEGHEYEGWTNPGTWWVALMLKNDRKHYDAVNAMKRKNGTINPNKIARYAFLALAKDIDQLREDEHTFILRWIYLVDWQEIADEWVGAQPRLYHNRMHPACWEEQG